MLPEEIFERLSCCLSPVITDDHLLKSFLNWLYQKDFSKLHPSVHPFVWIVGEIFLLINLQLWIRFIRACLAFHHLHSWSNWISVYSIFFSIIFMTIILEFPHSRMEHLANTDLTFPFAALFYNPFFAIVSCVYFCVSTTQCWKTI